MEQEVPVELGVASDTGRQRAENEDSLAIAPPNLPPQERALKGTLCLVADGIGGHRAGKMASDLVARLVLEEYYRPPAGDVAGALRRAIRIANAEVYRLAQEPATRKMGSTVVAAVFLGSTLTVAHVGDSRAYLIGADGIQALTRDHSWVAQQLENGLLSEEQAHKHVQRHVLTRSMGSGPEVNVDVIHTSLHPGDQVLLCTDGLWETVDQRAIEAVVRAAPPAEAARRLVDLANQRGGPDNVTAVVARPALGPVVVAPPAAPPAPAGALEQVLPDSRRARWLILAAAVVALLLALACGAALLLGNEPEDEARPTLPAGTGTGSLNGSPPLITATLPASPAVQVQAVVTATLPLAVRQSPSQGALVLQWLEPGAGVTVTCQVEGDAVDGNSAWYRTPLGDGAPGYVTAQWLRLENSTPEAVPACTD